MTWSAATGGLYGVRGAGDRVDPDDDRVFLAPYLDWFVLTPPTTVPGMLASASGDVDTVVATGTLPKWLGGLRNLDAESGGSGDGPALLMTVGSKGKRIGLPDLARMMLGISDGSTTIPTPKRLTVTLTIVKLGFELKGHAIFATPADALEMYTLANAVKATAEAAGDDASMMSALRRLSMTEPTSETLTFATSMSTQDGLDGLALATGLLKKHYADMDK